MLKADETLTELLDLLPSRWDARDESFFVEPVDAFTFRLVDTTDQNEGREDIVHADSLESVVRKWLAGNRKYIGQGKAVRS